MQQRSGLLGNPFQNHVFLQTKVTRCAVKWNLSLEGSGSEGIQVNELQQLNLNPLFSDAAKGICKQRTPKGEELKEELENYCRL